MQIVRLPGVGGFFELYQFSSICKSPSNLQFSGVKTSRGKRRELRENRNTGEIGDGQSWPASGALMLWIQRHAPEVAKLLSPRAPPHQHLLARRDSDRRPVFSFATNPRRGASALAKGSQNINYNDGDSSPRAGGVLRMRRVGGASDRIRLISGGLPAKNGQALEKPAAYLIALFQDLARQERVKKKGQP